MYNENGLRVQKTVNGVVTKYTLHGKNIVHMTQGSNSLHFFYDASNKPAVVVFNGTPYSYVKNLQGDIVAILDSNKNVVVKYVYDAWGRPISKTGSMAGTLGTVQPFRYRGYVYDEETGLYYLRSRYYSPLMSRFSNSDSLLGKVGKLLSHNIFSYCRNSIIMRIDSHGMEDEMYRPISGTFTDTSILAAYEYKWHPDNSSFVGKVFIVQYNESIELGDYVVDGSSENDVIVIDKRFNSTDPELIVQDSKGWGLHAMLFGCLPIDNHTLADILIDYNETTKADPRITTDWGRSADSLATELWCHQFAYSFGIKPISTKDTNLNRNDEGKGIFAFFWERIVK